MMKSSRDKVSGLLLKHKAAAITGMVIFYFGCRLGEMYRISGGDLFLALSHMDYMIKTAPRIHMPDVKWGVTCTMLSGFFLYYQKLTSKNMRPGVEYGSAR